MDNIHSDQNFGRVAKYLTLKFAKLPLVSLSLSQSRNVLIINNVVILRMQTLGVSPLLKSLESDGIEKVARESTGTFDVSP